MGVVHVLERLEYHQGHLPLKNAVIQFFMAGLALLSGQSVGREGPSVHLGATAGSVLGRSLRVPNNGVRTLVGCGVAAAISAAFNTPLAGVIFAMEVVIMDYTVMGFTPVILAAVSATSLTRIVYGDATVFTLPEMQPESIYDLPMVALLGAFIGCVAASFIQFTLYATNFLKSWAIWIRTTLAGLITGIIAMVLPEVMGTGYDTVNSLLFAQIGLFGVFLLMLAKLVATSTAIGLGIPAGLIGPTVFIGAAAGGLIGYIAQTISPELQGPGYYAMLGMSAMMAATLQAPLAALIFLLELTGQQAVILPGMAAVIIASMMTRVVFNKTSIYQHLLLARGLDYRNTAMSKELRRIGVASVMEKNIRRHARHLEAEKAAELLAGEPRWILLVDEEDQRKSSLLPATDLARHLNELQNQQQDLSNVVLDLMTIPAKRLESRAIAIVATLQEAHERMQAEDCDVLFITGAHGATKQRIYGVITREHIDRSYQF
jgi:CIC family chloride channel protein